MGLFDKIGSFWNDKAKPAVKNYGTMMSNGYKGLASGTVKGLMTGNPVEAFTGAIKGGLSGAQRGAAVIAMRREGTRPDPVKIGRNIALSGDVPTEEAVAFETALLNATLAGTGLPPNNPTKRDEKVDPNHKSLGTRIKNVWNNLVATVKKYPVWTGVIIVAVVGGVLIWIFKPFKKWGKKFRS